jgi:hypothetical protein
VHDPSETTRRLNEMVRRFTPRQPNWNYFQSKDGWIFGWSTERMGDGKFAAFIHKPRGKGARSGKAQAWIKVRELHFAKRATAKARALKWMKTHERRARDRAVDRMKPVS